MAVLESIRALDHRFVASVIRARHLDPAPLPQRWKSWSRDGKSVTVERYSWGRVVYASDSDVGWSSTLVLVGKVDTSSNSVRGKSGLMEIIPVPWIDAVDYSEMEGRRMSVRIPDCLGLHDHCSTCDGGYNKDSATVEEVCSWRSRCYALKLHLMEANTTAEQYIADFTDPMKLHVALADLERKHALKIIPPAIKPPKGIGKARGTLTPKLRPRRRKAKGIDPERYKELEPLVRAFLRRLRRSLKRLGYVWRAKRSLALPGEVFAHRVTAQSNFVTVYIAADGRYAKVARIKLKALLKRIDIAFPASWERALALPGARLKRQPDPTLPVFYRGVRTKLLARKAAWLIGKMIRLKVIRLPPPRRVT